MENKKNEQKKNCLVSKPQFFNLKNELQNDEFQHLINTSPGIKIFDEIKIQINDLIKCRNPKIKFSKELLEQYYTEFIQDINLDEYGVWVYYPWSNNLIHLLSEKEFIEVRTNRNKHKITQEEQDLLATKKVGVIGLSVGQSVALTLAMERSFGELRIADFDTLELSNLNRIRTGLHNLMVPKTVSVAREIAEIDPFLKVICFNEGIREDNMDSFFSEGGSLDVLIDECDSLDIKIKVRLKARELRIPVLMDTSDRGMLDIERFDLEPERPILHGLIEESQYDHISNIEIIKKIIDFENSSERLVLSFKELGKSLCAWPQLASSVISGGAHLCEITRLILLGSKLSGRGFMDLLNMEFESVTKL